MPLKVNACYLDISNLSRCDLYLVEQRAWGSFDKKYAGLLFM